MKFSGFDHHIQRQIFLKMRQQNIARYADLTIKGIESSQFMYHLKELIKKGLIEKVDKGRYKLTNDGILLSQAFSTAHGDVNLAPLTYTLIFARSNKGRWLIIKRAKQPHFDKLACISGKVHMHETLHEAAKREWYDHLGSESPQLVYKGYCSVLIKDEKSVNSHIAGPVWVADNVEEVWETKKVERGLFMWADWRALEYKQFIPGWKELVGALEDVKEPFLLDLEFKSSDLVD